MDTHTLPQILGANFRRIRIEHGVTQAEAASHCRRFGLKWDASRLGNFEQGRYQTPFSTVLAAAAGLDNAVSAGHGLTRNRPRVLLADLVQSDGFVSLTTDFSPDGDTLAAFCSGKTWELPSDALAETADVAALLDPAPGIAGEYGMSLGQLRDAQKRSDVTETRLARKLNIPRDHLLALCWSRFHGRTFSEERDRLSASNPARRAVVSAELRRQLEQELTDGND